MLSLEGRAALVTGGSRGIGRAVCVLFGRLGARVGVNYRGDLAAAQETVEMVQAAGGQAVALRADVSRHEEAGRLVAEAEAALGGLEVVVVNHGIWKRASLPEMTPETWSETLRVNLDGVYSVCHHAARAMIPRGRGNLVLIASTSGQRGEAHYSHYSATKGAVIAFTKSLASELGPHGLRVNAVAPGWVLTDMSREALEGPEGAEAVRPIPLGRAGRPEEIAGPVAFLASDLASYLHGEVLCVNGGAVMTG
jgi:NAD(P)-dependent dehydrogenase (short-subunit alcohol dehydrogenase family)